MNKTLQVFSFSILILFLYSCTGSSRKGSGSTISGHISDLTDSSVILEEWKINEIVKVAEVPLAAGSFSFQTELVKGSMYLVKLGGFKLPVIADSDSIYITGTAPEFKDVTIVGSEASRQIWNFTQQVEELNNELAVSRLIYDSLSRVDPKDSLTLYYQIRHDQGLMEITNLLKSFADTTQYFQAALYSIRKLDPNSDIDFFERFVDNIPKRFPDNEAAKMFGDMMRTNINKIQKTGVAVGQEAPDFTLRDMDNNPINLSEFKGSYVLLTFWASWCPPCRHENKSLIQVHDSFEKRNFKMIHVSIDKDLSKLKRAIHKDGLKWLMLNDPNEWESNTVNLYGFHKIPSNYLIDPQGRIVAKNLFGNELFKYLTDLYNSDITAKELE